MQGQRLVAPAPGIAGAIIAFDDDRRDAELAQSGSERNPALSTAYDDHLRLAVVAEFGVLGRSLFLPCDPFGIGPVFGAFGAPVLER